jgi:hypothetical protein
MLVLIDDTFNPLEEVHLNASHRLTRITSAILNKLVFPLVRNDGIYYTENQVRKAFYH